MTKAYRTKSVYETHDHLQLITTSFSLFSMHPLFILVNVKLESIEDI